MRFAKQKIWKIARNSEISLKDGNNIQEDTNDIVVNKKNNFFCSLEHHKFSKYNLNAIYRVAHLTT